ncbi:hypothetical protein DSL72_009338 [Monilinia vaccinii-corymbosi]|uniref:Uncharacterized protein n=1 Tax=Monilinia vaccinii-corymbosi TaxID=61207 RepID=A0A8A3PQT3_9HELO|nr:hypothetical protein DSL72_009338 [Monilinia vaccinii-corymbosi]
MSDVSTFSIPSVTSFAQSLSLSSPIFHLDFRVCSGAVFTSSSQSSVSSMESPALVSEVSSSLISIETGSITSSEIPPSSTAEYSVISGTVIPSRSQGANSSLELALSSSVPAASTLMSSSNSNFSSSTEIDPWIAVATGPNPPTYNVDNRNPHSGSSSLHVSLTLPQRKPIFRELLFLRSSSGSSQVTFTQPISACPSSNYLATGYNASLLKLFHLPANSWAIIPSYPDQRIHLLNVLEQMRSLNEIAYLQEKGRSNVNQLQLVV